jgi:hypothetical protein
LYDLSCSILDPLLDPALDADPSRTQRVALDPSSDADSKDKDAEVLKELGEHGDVPARGKDVGLEIGRDEGEEGRDEGEERGGWRSELEANESGERGRERGCVRMGRRSNGRNKRM